MKNKCHSTKRTRQQKYQAKLFRLAQYQQYPPVVYCFYKSDHKIEWYVKPYHREQVYCRRCYLDNHTKIHKHHKKVANRKFRYYKGDLSGGSDYKRLYDLYWHEI